MHSALIAGFYLYFLGLIVVCFTAGDNSLAIVRLAATLLGASYGAFGWFFIWDLFPSDGIYFVGLLCTIVWSGDTVPISVERASVDISLHLECRLIKRGKGLFLVS